MSAPWTPSSRVEAARAMREADRPPVFLLPTMHGARELGLSLRTYFAKAEHVVEGQVRLRARYGHDCYSSFFHAALELEAWGGTALYRDDGPPNAGEPLVHTDGQLAALQAPRVEGQAVLGKVLDTIRALVARARGEVPVLGVVLAPFSLPVLQLGFVRYLDLLLDAQQEPQGPRARLLHHLLAVNEDFAVRWGQAQLAAGASALVYFDPLSSGTMTTAALGVELGLAIARRVLGQLPGPVGVHFASGRVASRLEAVLATGAQFVGVSAEDDLAAVKRACAGRATLVGNLNGVQMARWTPTQARVATRAALDAGAPGGGFVLADNHGEIPFQVSEEVLLAIMAEAEAWGRARRGPAR